MCGASEHPTDEISLARGGKSGVVRAERFLVSLIGMVYK